MACLDDIVGVKGCGDSPTGVYVQQLPGITISDYDKAISVEHKAAYPALQEKVTFAAKYVAESIRSQLANKYELKSFIENSVLGYYYDDKPVVEAQTGYLTGYQIRIDSTPYLKFYIPNLSLFANTTGNVSVFVYDLIQGKLLDTITVAAVAGQIVTVNVEKEYYTNKQRLNLFIGYASTFESYRTSYYQNQTGWGANEWCNCCFSGGATSNIYFRPAKILIASAKLNTNVEGMSYGAGLSLGYSLQCSFDEYLCNAKNQIAFPVLYKAGAMIMQEMRYSKRFSGVITNFQAEHGELELAYDAEYNKLMRDLMHNMVIPESTCFSCNKQTRSVVNLP